MAWASSSLSKRVPTVSLLSWRPIISVLVNIFLMTIFLVLILSVMQTQNWYAAISNMYSILNYLYLTMSHSIKIPHLIKIPHSIKISYNVCFDLFYIIFVSIYCTV